MSLDLMLFFPDRLFVYFVFGPLIGNLQAFWLKNIFVLYLEIKKHYWEKHNRLKRFKRMFCPHTFSLFHWPSLQKVWTGLAYRI